MQNSDDQKREFKPGGFLSGQKFKIENGFLTYKNAYAKSFQVDVSKIETTSLSVVGFGKSELRIIGCGTELAKVVLPTPWAEKVQQWIASNIK